MILNLSYDEFLQHCKPFRMAFADPPDNTGLKYKGYRDRIPNYPEFMESIIIDSLKKCDVLWLSFNSRYTTLVGSILYGKEYEVKPCVQVYTFGQHNSRDLGNNHRPLYRISNPGLQLHPDAIRVPSWRQLHGDKRADPRGRVPGDVFDFPRVTGNSKQRRKFSPTQLHEGLYERCIRLCCKPGDTVVDLFAGSGTLGRVASRCKIKPIMVEVSPEICEEIARDQRTEVQ